MPVKSSRASRAGKDDVLVMAYGPRKVRAITHLDVTAAQCEQAAAVLKEVAER